jgi:hypothetical protein
VRRTPFQQQGQVFLAVRCNQKGTRPKDELCHTSAAAAVVFDTNQEVNMSIDELMVTLTAAKKELGGNAEVVCYDSGSSDKLGVVRIEGSSVQTAVIEDLGGQSAWTLDERKPGTKVRCLLLE